MGCDVDADPVSDALNDHLRDALSHADDEETRYHIRSALQHHLVRRERGGAT